MIAATLTITADDVGPTDDVLVKSMDLSQFGFRPGDDVPQSMNTTLGNGRPLVLIDTKKDSDGFALSEYLYQQEGSNLLVWAYY